MNEMIYRATVTILWAIIEIDAPGDGLWRDAAESLSFFFGLLMVMLNGRRLIDMADVS